MSHSAPEIRLPARHSVYLVLLIDRRCRSLLLRQKNMPHLALWWQWVDIRKCYKAIGKTLQLVVITPDRCTSLRSVRLKIRYRGPYSNAEKNILSLLSPLGFSGSLIWPSWNPVFRILDKYGSGIRDCIYRRDSWFSAITKRNPGNRHLEQSEFFPKSKSWGFLVPKRLVIVT